MKIKATKGNVVILVDMMQKFRHQLTPDIELYIERGYDFNRRVDYPSFGICIDGENIPEGANVLFHHNATEIAYEIFSHNIKLEKGVKLFSIPVDMVFMYRDATRTWVPCKNFVISLRLFKPCSSLLLKHEPPEQIKNRMYIVRGEHEGNVAITTAYCDYCIEYVENGVPGKIIRTRTREIIGLDDDMNEQLKRGKILIGIEPQTAELIIPLIII